MENHEVKLYAQWKEIEYKISFTKDISDTEVVGENYTLGPIKYYEEKTVSKETFKKENYTFTNYEAIKVDGSSDISQVKVRSIIGDTGFSKVIEKDNAIVEYIARFTEDSIKEYTIRMYANNGSTEYIDQVASVSVATKLKKNEFTKKDYRFLGWSKEAEGQVLYGDEEEVSENIRERDQIIELYAIWALNNYRVIYDKGIARDINSETHDISGIVTVGVATINELYKVKDNAFSVEGFTFIGWDIEENTNYGRYKEKAELWKI